MSEDGKVLVIHTVCGIHVWFEYDLVQSINVAALVMDDCEKQIAPQTTAAACYIDPSSNSFVIATLLDHSWCFILQSERCGRSTKQKVAYKLILTICILIG